MEFCFQVNSRSLGLFHEELVSHRLNIKNCSVKTKRQILIFNRWDLVSSWNSPCILGFSLLPPFYRIWFRGFCKNGPFVIPNLFPILWNKFGMKNGLFSPSFKSASLKFFFLFYFYYFINWVKKLKEKQLGPP